MRTMSYTPSGLVLYWYVGLHVISGLLGRDKWDQNLTMLAIMSIVVGYLPTSLITAQLVVLSLTPSTLLQNLTCRSSTGFFLLSKWMKLLFFLFTGKHIVPQISLLYVAVGNIILSNKLTMVLILQELCL